MVYYGRRRSVFGWPVRTSALLGSVALGFIAVGCVVAALTHRSAVLPPSTHLKAAPSPESKPAKRTQYGGATPIASARWIDGIQLPELHYTPHIVLVAFDITASGAAQHCKVAAPVPQGSFGEEVCAAMERNARFLPKRDAHGKAVSTRGWVRVRIEYNE